jgi:hypothetical protein
MKEILQAQRQDISTDMVSNPTYWVSVDSQDGQRRIYIGNEGERHQFIVDHLPNNWLIKDGGYAGLLSADLNVYGDTWLLEKTDDSERESSIRLWKDFAEKNRLNLKK